MYILQILNFTFALGHQQLPVTIASDHLPCLSQLHLTISHACLTCANKHACLIHLHRTSIHICYCNIRPSVLSVALASDQYSSNVCYNCTGTIGLHFTVTPKQHPAWLGTSTACTYLTQVFVLSHCTPLRKLCFLSFLLFYTSVHLQLFSAKCSGILIRKSFVL